MVESVHARAWEHMVVVCGPRARRPRSGPSSRRREDGAGQCRGLGIHRGWVVPAGWGGGETEAATTLEIMQFFLGFAMFGTSDIASKSCCAGSQDTMPLCRPKMKRKSRTHVEIGLLTLLQESLGTPFSSGLQKTRLSYFRFCIFCDQSYT